MADYATMKSFETEGTSVAAREPRGSDAVWAYTILRLSFGANIMLHGVSRLVAGHAAFLAYLSHYFEKTPLVPASLLPTFAWVLPPVETTLGLLLFLGLWTRFALIAGGLVLTLLVYRDKSGSGLECRWTAINLRFPLLLSVGASRPERGFHRWDGEPLRAAVTTRRKRARSKQVQ